jgi:hypothetical protein
MLRREIVIVFLLLLFQSPSKAQTFPPGAFQIGGTPVGCGAVWTFIGPGAGDMARAVPAMPNQPATIWLDPMFLQLPLPVQFFVYGHECAHHVIGLNENAADCWSAKLGRQQGWFTLQTMYFLTQAFAWNPGDWTHAPGPVRLQQIFACYSTP